MAPGVNDVLAGLARPIVDAGNFLYSQYHDGKPPAKAAIKYGKHYINQDTYGEVNISSPMDLIPGTAWIDTGYGFTGSHLAGIRYEKSNKHCESIGEDYVCAIEHSRKYWWPKAEILELTPECCLSQRTYVEIPPFAAKKYSVNLFEIGDFDSKKFVLDAKYRDEFITDKINDGNLKVRTNTRGPTKVWRNNVHLVLNGTLTQLGPDGDIETPYLYELTILYKDNIVDGLAGLLQ